MPTARARLLRHPLAPWGGPELSIAATCSVGHGGAGECCFEVEGALDRVVVPVGGAPARRDGLWRHTCFELFIARRGDPGYLEFNFAPGGDWAAYAFSGYRAVATLPQVAAPRIGVVQTDARLSLTARIGAGSWPDPDRGELEIGLAAVIEADGGALGYYALGHPAERPDFHDRRGFQMTLGHAVPAS